MFRTQINETYDNRQKISQFLPYDFALARLNCVEQFLSDDLGIQSDVAACKLFFTFLPPTNEVCEGYVFTGVCLSTGGMHGRGACMVGGMHGGGGVHGKGGGRCAWWGHVWQGACVVGGMHGEGACAAGGHAWLGTYMMGGLHGGEACMVGEVCMVGGHAWHGGVHGRGVHGTRHAWQGGMHGRSV